MLGVNLRAPTEVIATRVPTRLADRWKVLAAENGIPVSRWLERAAVLADAYLTLEALPGAEHPTAEQRRNGEIAARAVIDAARALHRSAPPERDVLN
jgi:hypothetical protein